MTRRALLALALLLMAVCPWLTVAAAPACTAYTSPPTVPVWEAPGVTLCLHGGTYPHAGLLRLTAISATYMSAPGETARLVGPGLDISGHDVTLGGIVIDNNGAGVPAVVLRGDRVTLTGDDIHNGRYNGAELRGAGDSVTLSRVHDFDSGVAGQDAHCIVVEPGAGAGTTITANTIYSCSGDGVQAYYPNTDPAPTAYASGLIAGNVFTRGLTAYSENAIDVKFGSWAITDNDMTGYGFEPYQLIAGGNPSLFIHKYAFNTSATNNHFHQAAKGLEVFGLAGLDAHAAPFNITLAGNVFDRVGPGYTITVSKPLTSVTTADNLSFPLGLPTATQTAVPSLTPSQTATPQATGTATPTQTPTETATVTETPTAEAGCWDLRHTVPLPIPCP